MRLSTASDGWMPMPTRRQRVGAVAVGAGVRWWLAQEGSGRGRGAHGWCESGANSESPGVGTSPSVLAPAKGFLATGKGCGGRARFVWTSLPGSRDSLRRARGCGGRARFVRTSLPGSRDSLQRVRDSLRRARGVAVARGLCARRCPGQGIPCNVQGCAGLRPNLGRCLLDVRDSLRCERTLHEVPRGRLSGNVGRDRLQSTPHTERRSPAGVP